MTIILLIFIAILLILVFSILNRNNRVLKFRLKLIELHFIWIINNNYKCEGTSDFIKRIPSYDRMLYSFKKLSFENWLSTEDIKRLVTSNNN